MTESNGPDQPGADPTPQLTPMAAAIAGFTLAVLSLIGHGSWGYPIQAHVGALAPNGSDQKITVYLGLAEILIAGLGLLLARSALRSDGSARHLAGATLVVGGLSVLVGLIAIVSAATL